MDEESSSGKTYGTSRRIGVAADVAVPIVKTGRPKVTVVTPRPVGTDGKETLMALTEASPCDRGIPNNVTSRGWHNFQAGIGGIVACTYCGQKASPPVLTTVRPSTTGPFSSTTIPG